MKEQYNEITAWKCIKCGRVLTTIKGIENHKQKCKYIAIPMDGQLKLNELIQ